MGDIASMTDCYGHVNGFRLLRWLRSRARWAEQLESEYTVAREAVRAAHHNGQAALLNEMADDLERELTPPDYPEDDSEGAKGLTAEDYRLLDGLTAPNDNVVNLDDPAFLGRPEQE